MHMLPVLKRGIGIHHGGLLPLLKEVVEILFQEGLLKILFSTETFSLGLNMPARTVVFTSVRKFDGEEIRLLQGGEYIQMSGRAGRRGLDDLGYTILMVDEKMDMDSAKNMLKGHADPLYSSFHLNNNMLINSMRIEDTDPEYIIRRSFLQFKNDKAVPEMMAKYEELKTQRDTLVIENEPQITEVYKIDQQIAKYKEDIRKIVNLPQHICQFLCIGRLIHIINKGKDFGWGISINFF